MPTKKSPPIVAAAGPKLSTKLSIEDYNAFLMLIKLEYQAGLTSWFNRIIFSFNDCGNALFVILPYLIFRAYNYTWLP